MKTCQKLGLFFYHFLGDRLGIGNIGHPVPPLPAIILARPEHRSHAARASIQRNCPTHHQCHRICTTYPLS
jgi:hypothetical protein